MEIYLTDDVTDNIDSLAFLHGMPDESVDLIITDIPSKYESECLDDVLDELARVQKPTKKMYLWTKSQYLDKYIAWVRSHNYDFEILTWHFTNPLPATDSRYFNDTEFILYIKSDDAQLYGCQDSRFTYFIDQLNQAEKRKYKCPLVKPLYISKVFILNSSEPFDIVFDPFANVMTNAYAARYVGRRFICCEPVTTWCNRGIRRVYENV